MSVRRHPGKRRFWLPSRERQRRTLRVVKSAGKIIAATQSQSRYRINIVESTDWQAGPVVDAGSSRQCPVCRYRFGNRASLAPGKADQLRSAAGNGVTLPVQRETETGAVIRIRHLCDSDKAATNNTDAVLWT